MGTRIQVRMPNIISTVVIVATVRCLATMWASMGSGITRVVARYVMVFCLALEDPRPGLLAEVRHLEDRLGLSPVSLRRLEWIIEDVPAVKDERTPEQRAQSEDRWAAILGMDTYR